MVANTWHAFTEQSIERNASTSGGVYRIDTRDDCIYVGQASNIRRRLLEHVRGESDQSGCILRNKATLFRYELIADKNDRDEREQELIDNLDPECNR